MNGFIAFSKKEFTEQFKSFRAVILIAVLFLFGMTSPLLAKLTPDILKSVDLQGMTISMPAPTVLDAYAQFFKNIPMGFIVLLLVCGGLLSQDVTRGTLIVLLAKGLSRHAVIASKFVSAFLVWTAGYALSAATALGYTFYLFGSSAAPNLLLAFLCPWLFGTFILALLLLASTAAPGNYGGLLLTAGILIVLLILGSFPALARLNPTTVSSGTGLLNGQVNVGDMMVTVWFTAGLTVLCLALASAVFRKKRL
jgi:ABC-2 type transport system permease protein